MGQRSLTLDFANGGVNLAAGLADRLADAAMLAFKLRGVHGEDFAEESGLRFIVFDGELTERFLDLIGQVQQEL